MSEMNLILDHLYERYYQPANQSDQAPYVSSHWNEELQGLLAERSVDGNITLASDYYWGCRWKSPLGRVFDVAHRAVHVPGLSHRLGIFKLNRAAAKLCHRMDLDPTYNVFRQVCTVELLARNLDLVAPEDHLRILVIGDGNGVLSSLLKEVFPTASIVLVDIGKSLLYQAYHCQKAHPNQRHSLAMGQGDTYRSDFVYCPTEELDSIEGHRFDIAVNEASMREMNEATIARYFDFMRNGLHPKNLFYCCNRESKTLVGGEVSKFYDYPWQQEDKILVDEECPWHRFIVGRYRAELGPTLLGRRIPFLSYFDGSMLHRLAVLAI